MTAAPNFIWSVKVKGNSEIEKEKILSDLKDLGIYPGALKIRLPGGFETKDALLERNRSLIWAWVYIKGTTAEAVVSEDDLPPMIVDRKAPCSIRAACDAYLKSVTVLNGEKLVSAGNVVQAGDTIVSGKVPVYKEGYPEKYEYVHAMAKTEAYTERRAEGVYTPEYEHRTLTGNKKSTFYIEIAGKRFCLFKNAASAYETCDTESSRHEFLCFAVGADVYKEVDITKEPMSLEGVLSLAKEELEQDIAKRLCRDAVLLDEDIQYEYVSDNKIKVKLTMSCLEDIGTEVPIEAPIEIPIKVPEISIKENNIKK